MLNSTEAGEKMLKIFTITYSEKTENYPDLQMSDFLVDKEVHRFLLDKDELSRCLW